MSTSGSVRLITRRVLLCVAALPLLALVACSDESITNATRYRLSIEWEAVLDSSAYVSTSVGSLIPTDDGGALVVFTGYSGSENHACLARLDETGTVRWQQDYSDSTGGSAVALVRVSDTSYAIVGNLLTFGNDVTITEVDTLGDSVWQRTVGSFYLNSNNILTRMTDGSFIVTGRNPSVNSDQVMVKATAHGQVIWSRTQIETGIQDLRASAETDDGGLVFARISNEGDANEADLEILRTNADGDRLWLRDHGLPLADVAHSVCKTSNGFAFGGFARRPAGNDYARILMVDTGGNKIWTYTDQHTDRHTSCNDVVSAANGDILGIGYDLPLCCGRTGDLLLVRLQPDGSLVWKQKLGPYDLGYWFAIDEAPDGDLLVAFDDGDFVRVLKVRVNARS